MESSQNLKNVQSPELSLESLRKEAYEHIAKTEGSRNRSQIARNPRVWEGEKRSSSRVKGELSWELPRTSIIV